MDHNWPGAERRTFLKGFGTARREVTRPGSADAPTTQEDRRSRGLAVSVGPDRGEGPDQPSPGPTGH